VNSLLISLDLKVESVCNMKFLEESKRGGKGEKTDFDLDKVKELDEFELAEITSEFSKLLREQILDILN